MGNTCKTIKKNTRLSHPLSHLGSGAFWFPAGIGEVPASPAHSSRSGLRAPLQIVKDFEKAMYILLYLKWITNKNLLYSTRNSAQCASYVPVWMVGRFGSEWIHVYVRLSPFTVHLKLSQYC